MKRAATRMRQTASPSSLSSPHVRDGNRPHICRLHVCMTCRVYALARRLQPCMQVGSCGPRSKSMFSCAPATTLLGCSDCQGLPFCSLQPFLG